MPDRFVIAEKKRCKEIIKLKQGQTIEMKNHEAKNRQGPTLQQALQPRRLGSPRRRLLGSPRTMEISNKHVIGSFNLEFDSSQDDCVEIIATLPEPTLPIRTPIKPEEEKMYELYICNCEGHLLYKLLFLESDYRKAARRAINYSRHTEQD